MMLFWNLDIIIALHRTWIASEIGFISSIRFYDRNSPTSDFIDFRKRKFPYKKNSRKLAFSREKKISQKCQHFRIDFAFCEIEKRHFCENPNRVIFADLGTRSLFTGSLSAHFISMDRYRTSAHLANFQVRSSLYRSRKNQWFALGKER